MSQHIPYVCKYLFLWIPPPAKDDPPATELKKQKKKKQKKKQQPKKNKKKKAKRKVSKKQQKKKQTRKKSKAKQVQKKKQNRKTKKIILKTGVCKHHQSNFFSIFLVIKIPDFDPEDGQRSYGRQKKKGLTASTYLY